MTMTDDRNGHIVYRTNPLRRFGHWLIFGPLMLLVAVLAVLIRANITGTLAVISGCLLLPALAIQWLMSRARLDLSPTGVKLTSFGRNLETTWPNVVDMRLDRGREGLITRAPLEGKTAQQMAANCGLTVEDVPIYDDGQRALMAERRYIPINAFAWYLRHRDLGAAIVGLAPHLQSAWAAGPQPALKAARQRAQPKTPEERRQDRILQAIVAVIFLIGLAVWAKSPARLGSLAELAIGLLVLPGAAIGSAYGARVCYRGGAPVLSILQAFMAVIRSITTSAFWAEWWTGIGRS
jgi:hypothetical protein